MHLLEDEQVGVLIDASNNTSQIMIKTRINALLQDNERAFDVVETEVISRSKW